MRGPSLDLLRLRGAIEALAAKLPPGSSAEMTIIGGGAGMMSNLFPESRSTVDLDVLDCEPPEILDLCCYHAPAVAEALGISPGWFDATPLTMRHMMLPGWRNRCVDVGAFGPLRVKSIGRIDLIALKVMAGRSRDLEDLGLLKVAPGELDQVIEVLPSLITQGANPDDIEKGISVARVLGGSR
ncbi:MAG: hypothetical protein RLZZ565_256 [Planctomycetota bacterium]